MRRPSNLSPTTHTRWPCTRPDADADATTAPRLFRGLFQMFRPQAKQQVRQGGRIEIHKPGMWRSCLVEEGGAAGGKWVERGRGGVEKDRGAKRPHSFLLNFLLSHCVYLLGHVHHASPTPTQQPATNNQEQERQTADGRRPQPQTAAAAEHSMQHAGSTEHSSGHCAGLGAPEPAALCARLRLRASGFGLRVAGGPLRAPGSGPSGFGLRAARGSSSRPRG
jgi:hypothetical protein